MLLGSRLTQQQVHTHGLHLLVLIKLKSLLLVVAVLVAQLIGLVAVAVAVDLVIETTSP